MQRPDHITNVDIIRWAGMLDSDKELPGELVEQPIIREVCYAGFWIQEELKKLNCPRLLRTRIQYSAGKASFGNDIWEVHKQFLNGYKNNQLDVVMVPNNIN